MKPFISSFGYPATISTSAKGRRTVWVDEQYPFTIEEAHFDASDRVFSIETASGETIGWHYRNGELLRPVLTHDGQGIAREHMLCEPLASLSGTDTYFSPWPDHPFFSWQPWQWGPSQHVPGLTRSKIEGNDPLFKSFGESFKRWRGDSRNEMLDLAAERVLSMRRDGETIYRPAPEPMYALELTGDILNVRPWLGGNLHDHRCPIYFFRADERNVAIHTGELLIEGGLRASLQVDERVIEIHGDFTPQETTQAHVIQAASTAAHLDGRKLQANEEHFQAVSRYVHIRSCVDAAPFGSMGRLELAMHAIIDPSYDGEDQSPTSYWQVLRSMHDASIKAHTMSSKYLQDLDAIGIP